MDDWNEIEHAAAMIRATPIEAPAPDMVERAAAVTGAMTIGTGVGCLAWMLGRLFFG